MRPRKRVARVTSDSSDSSDSQITERVKKNAKPDSHNESDACSGWKSKDVPQSELQPSSSKVIKLEEDRSDNEAEKCPICLASLKNQEVGSHDACDHSFCAGCIQEWAKSVNTCPVDRKKFHSILVRNNYNGQYVGSIPVQEPSSNTYTIHTQDVLLDESDYPPCATSTNVDRLQLCDGCDYACHLDCLEAPHAEVPEDEWLCANCVATWSI